MTSPSAGFGPGRITLTVVVGSGGGDGCGPVEAVRVGSSRPVGFSATLFAGRTADEVPAQVGRLHALCGLSHATASAMAIAAACGEEAEPVLAAHFDGLAAERLGEHLRSIFTGPIGGSAGGAAVGRETLADLRGVLAAARGVTTAADAATRAAAIDRLRDGVARLGLRLGPDGRFDPVPGSWAAAVAAAYPGGDVHLPADRLGAADDAAVISALAADPIGYSAAPWLGDRRPETGPFARTAAASGGETFDGPARLEARLAEIAAAAAALGGAAGAATEWARAGLLDSRTGYAAVESPRGRLHHLVRVDIAGRVASYAILAPTEWNFGPRGPLVATLMANRLARGPDAAAQVERIAAAFDPCVGFAVEVEERADA